MAKYLIFNDGDMLRTTSTPVWCAELGENEIHLTGEQEWIDQYERYFANPEAGWEIHLAEEDPFESFRQRSSMANIVTTDDEAEFNAAKEAIKDGVEKTVSWPSQS